jgi:hypothetical protein
MVGACVLTCWWVCVGAGARRGRAGVELVSSLYVGKLHVDIKFYIETGKKYRSLFVP